MHWWTDVVTPRCGVRLRPTAQPPSPGEAPQAAERPAEGALDRDELLRHVLVAAGQRALGHGGDPLVQLGQGGGERGDLGGGGHPPMMADRRRSWHGGEVQRRKGPRSPPVALCLMSLRILDLRGTQPPFDAALPRPSAPGCRRPRRRGGDPARRCGPRATAPWSATPPSWTRSTCPTASGCPERRSSRRAPTSTPTCAEALEVAFGRILAYHAHEGTPPGDLVDGGITVGHLTRAVERAGIYAPGGRARYPSTVLMCAAPARVAGVGSIALCVPPAVGRQDRRRHAVRRLHRRGRRGLPDRRGPGDRRHGLRHARACPRST